MAEITPKTKVMTCIASDKSFPVIRETKNITKKMSNNKGTKTMAKEKVALFSSPASMYISVVCFGRSGLSQLGSALRSSEECC